MKLPRRPRRVSASLLFLAAASSPGGVGTPAAAASFACGKASGPVEAAICSDPGLSRLDERMAQAHAAAIRTLGQTQASQNGKPDEAAVAPLRADQRAWIAERDRCGAAVPCLRRQYQRRVSVLGFGPDPDAPGPVDRFVGRYTDGRRARGAILRLGPERAMVLLSDVEAGQARWTCEFLGEGQASADGSRLVATSEGEPGYTLRATPGTLEVDNDSGVGVWCGMNGAIGSPLRRQR